MTRKKVIQLLRVSTEAQAGEDRAGIAAQKTVCASIAKQHGLAIVKTIEMVNVSGTAVLCAPEMRELLTLIERPDIHGVVAREFSRLMRPENYSDFVILQAFAETKTMLYLPDGPIDFSNKTGRFLATIKAAVAGQERSEILERIASAKEQMRREGRWPNSPQFLPMGVAYDRATTKWSWTPEAAKVEAAFKAFLRGNTNYDLIARSILNTSRGTARNVLSNPIYTGWMVYDKKRDPY